MKPLIRAAIRRLASFVMSRPSLVALAARLFAVAPFLKPLARRLLSMAAALPRSRLARPLSPAEAGVLSDLQDAIEARKKVSR